MQITRQRVRPAVELDVMETCPTCFGKGKVQSTIIFTDKVQEQIEMHYETYGRGLKLHMHPYIYAYVSQGLVSLKLKWRLKYGVQIIENQGLGMLEIKFYDKNNETLCNPTCVEEEKVTEKSN
jgi:ribonuclease G